MTTQDNYYVNIPATYLTLEDKPSTKLLNLKKALVPTHEDLYEMLPSEIKKVTFH